MTMKMMMMMISSKHQPAEPFLAVISMGSLAGGDLNVISPTIFNACCFPPPPTKYGHVVQKLKFLNVRMRNTVMVRGSTSCFYTLSCAEFKLTTSKFQCDEARVASGS
jgi:hypothetical protein